MTRYDLVAFVSISLIAACNGKSNEGDAAVDTACEPDVSDVACDLDYPAGPYGTGVGEIVRNHELALAPCGTISMLDLFCDPDAKVLLVFGTAGWCTACIPESDALPGLYADYHDQGLEILALVFEDASGNPATVTFAGGYADHYGFTFPTAEDADKQIGEYFDTSQAPLNMFVNLETMEILEKSTGYEAAPFRTAIETHLASVP